MSARVALVMFYFSKKFCKLKIKFCGVSADTKMSISRFPMAFKMCCINKMLHKQNVLHKQNMLDKQNVLHKQDVT